LLDPGKLASRGSNQEGLRDMVTLTPHSLLKNGLTF